MTAAAFQATYSDFKLIRSRKVVQIILEVPLENSATVLSALGGMPNPGEEIWVGVAKLDLSKLQSGASAPGEAMAESPPGKAVASRQHKPVAPERRLTVRAGILCSDPVFRKWLGEICRKRDVTENEAAIFIRTECDVPSRKDITPGSEAALQFEKMEGAFLGWRDHDMPAEIPA